MANIPSTISPLSLASIRRVWEQLAQIFNGGITVGIGRPYAGATVIPAVNLAANGMAVSTSGGGTVDFVVTHNLGRVPEGYFVTQYLGQVNIWNGVGAWTTTTLTLRASVNGVGICLLVF